MRTLITVALLIATAAAYAARTIKALSAEDIEASMRARAKTIGAELIDAEAHLDDLFAARSVDDRALSASLQHIAELQAELRQAQLHGISNRRHS